MSSKFSTQRVFTAMFVLISLPTLILAVVGITPTAIVDAGQGSPPELLTDFTSRHRVAIGTKMYKLTCPVRSKPGEMVMIQWKKDGDQIDPDWSRYKLARSDRELRIRSVLATDSGRYSCEAVNGFGHRHVDFTLHAYGPDDDPSTFDDQFELTDTETAPEWLNDEEMQNAIASVIRIRPGEKAELRCPAKGNPRPKIRWTKNGQPFRKDSSPFAEFSSSLRFPSGQSQDTGIYICRVDNDHGALEARFDLRVTNDHLLSAEEPIIDDPLNTTVMRGHTAQFQCKVRSTQPPLIRWLKRIDPNSLHHLEESSSSSSQIVNAAGMTLLVLEDQRSSQTVHSGLDPQLYTNRLVIPKADDHHEGVYICVVTNPAGHIVYRAAHLTVLEENASMFAAQTVYLYIGAFVLILVLVLSTSAACFLRRHQLRKTSSNSSSKFPKPGSSTATTQLIPPPPKLQPPQLPPFKSPGRNNNRLNGLMTPNNYQTRTLPRSVYEENHLYEASSPMPPYWPGATLETDYDSDPNLPPGRLIQPYPSMYSCTRDMHNDSSTVMGSYSRR